MTCHMSLADNPPLQALHGIDLAIKTLYGDGENSNKVLLGYRHC